MRYQVPGYSRRMVEEGVVDCIRRALEEAGLPAAGRSIAVVDYGMDD